MITMIARKEHRGIQTIEVDDIQQAVYQRFAEDSRQSSSFLGTDFRTWDRAGLYALATKYARKYVARERINYMHFAGAFVYTPAIVEVYLKDAVWVELEDVIDIDGRVDVKNIIATLPLETKRVLFVHYGLDQPYKSETKEYKRVKRAVDTISDRLNMDSGVKLGDLADVA
jgi:hypothetical protein